jgi:hypothetical protein
VAHSPIWKPDAAGLVFPSSKHVTMQEERAKHADVDKALKTFQVNGRRGRSSLN